MPGFTNILWDSSMPYIRPVSKKKRWKMSLQPSWDCTLKSTKTVLVFHKFLQFQSIGTFLHLQKADNTRMTFTLPKYLLYVKLIPVQFCGAYTKLQSTSFFTHGDLDRWQRGKWMITLVFPTVVFHMTSAAQSNRLMVPLNITPLFPLKSFL